MHVEDDFATQYLISQFAPLSIVFGGDRIERVKVDNLYLHLWGCWCFRLQWNGMVINACEFWVMSSILEDVWNFEC